VLQKHTHTPKLQPQITLIPKNDDESKSLLLGDSIIKHVEINGVKTAVFPGIRTEQLGAKIEELAKDFTTNSPEVIILHAGTNIIKKSFCADEVMGDVYDLIRSTQRCFPRTKIKVNSVTYRCYINNRYLLKVNENIKWACEALKVTYCAVYSSVNDHGIGCDGLHLNRLGSKSLGNEIEQVIRICMNKGN
jgi:hypothetical protein